MRLVTYNVSGGRDPVTAGSVLAELRPHVVCLLEVPGTGSLKRLTRAAGLSVAARAGRRGTGTAVLVADAVRVRASSRVPLTTPRELPTREATHVRLSYDGLELAVTAVQLGLRPEVRRTNLDELLTFLGTVACPVVIGCDLNESVRSPVASRLASSYQDAYAVRGVGAGLTYPTADPSTRQDFVFVDPVLHVTASHVPVEGPAQVASHHRPVVVDLAPAAESGEPAEPGESGESTEPPRPPRPPRPRQPVEPRPPSPREPVEPGPDEAARTPHP